MNFQPRNDCLLERRAYEIGLIASGYPLKMMPMEVAVIPEICPSGPIPRLANMVQKYNADQYDRLSENGYRLNMVAGEYEKIKS